MPRRFPPVLRHRPAWVAPAALLLLLLSAGASPGGGIARADTGTVVSFVDVVRGSEVVALIVVKEAPSEATAWTIEVVRGYHGVAPGLLTIAPGPGDPVFRPGERWLILTPGLETLDTRAGLIALGVGADGTLTGPWDMVDVPATIDELDALLGPAPTSDPATAAANAPVAPTDRAVTLRDTLPLVAAGFVLAVLAVFLAAAAIAGRRLARVR